MALVETIYNQTNYDIAMKLYGNLDTLVPKICADNNISDLSEVNKEYSYDSNSPLINSAFTGYNYATDYNKNINVCEIPRNLIVTGATFNTLSFRFDNPISSEYQYYLSESNTEPSESDWISTFSSILNFSDLEEDFTYYLFLRKRCNLNLFSKSIVLSQKTVLYVCDIITGLTSSSITGSSVHFSWVSGSISNFQYKITLDNTPPIDGFTDTIENNVTITGLDSETTYYFWVRRNCDDIHYSSFATTNIRTIPSPPITSDLILYLDSNFGTNLVSGIVTEWDDLSDTGNTVFPILGSASSVPNLFGTKPGIRFNGSNIFKTPSNLIGLNGHNKATVYFVIKFTDLCFNRAIYHYNTGSSTGAGSLLSYPYFLSGNPVIHSEYDNGGGSGIALTNTRAIYNQPIIVELLIDITVMEQFHQFVYLVGGSYYESYQSGTDIVSLFGNYILTIGASSGNSNRGIFDMAQMLIYNDILSSPDRTSVINWIKSRYSF